MRKNLAFAALAAAALAAACAKESAPVSEQENLVRMTFTASSAPVTKTSLADDMGIIWSTEDRIGVYASGKNSPEPFGVASVSREGRTAEFSGSAPISSGYVAVYPYDSAFKLSESGDAVSVTVPPVQNAVLGSFDPAANVSVAQTSGTDLLFRNAGALLKITVGNDGVKSIRIVGKGSSDVLSGAVSLDLGGDVPAVKSVETGSSSVELVGDFVKGGSYYAVVCPGTFSDGMTLTLTDAADATVELVNDASLEAARNTVVDFGTVDVPAERWLRSYVLNGKAEIEKFVSEKGDKKETVKNLTIKGTDVDDAALQSIVSRVGTVRGTLTLEGVGDGSEGSTMWINTENFIEKMSCEGGFTFKNIPVDMNANVFQKDQFRIIHGDLIFENCPKVHLAGGGWAPLKNIERIEGSLILRQVNGFNGETIGKLQHVGGDFILSNLGSFWHLGGKTADLTYVGGDIVVENCGGFGEDSKYRFYGLHNLTHIGGNVILNGISGYMSVNEYNPSNQTVGLCVLRDYATSGVLSPDATVYIKKGGKEVAFEDITSCDPNAHNSYVLNGHDAVVRFVNAAGDTKETVKNLTVTGSDVTRDDFSSLGRRVGAIEGTLTVDGIGSSSSDLNFDWMSSFSEIGGLTIKNSYVGNPNGMQNIKKIAGDLVLESCPQFPNDWDPFKYLEEIGGNLKVQNWERGFSVRFMPSLRTVGGDFTLYRVSGGFWDFKSENLREIGGDLNIIDCIAFENFYGFHKLTKLGGNVNAYKSEGYSKDSNGYKWLPENDWDMNGKTGLVTFNVLKKRGIFNGTVTAYVWRPASDGGVYWYDYKLYESKAEEIIASESN